MDIKELQAALLPELQKTKDALEASLKAQVNEAVKAQLDEVNTAIKGLNTLPEGMKAEDLAKLSADMKTLIADFDKFQKEIGKKTPTKTGVPKSWQNALVEAYGEKKAEIDAIVKSGGNQTAPLVFELKDAVTISTENTIGAGATQYTLTENTNIISPIRKRVLTYLQNVSVGNISKPYALWVEETDEQGTPIFIGEGDGKTKLSVLYVEKTAQVKKIAVYGKVTTEMMDDLPQLIAYIQTNLMKRVDLKVEDQLFSGNGLGDNLKGLDSYATTFTGGDLAGKVSNPNEFDVINGVAAQVKKANGMCNAVFVNSAVVNSMLSNKTTYGEYIFPPGVTADAMGNITAFGMQIIGTNALAANTFVGGDLSAVQVRFRQGMTVQIGLDGNDFTNNLKTILVELRLVQFVSANDTAVLVKGNFSTARGLLDSGS